VRRCGELLKQIEPALGAIQNIRDGGVPKVTRANAAKDADLSKRQIKTAVRVADVPAEQSHERDLRVRQECHPTTKLVCVVSPLSA
jgi:hypothetical protein